MKVLKIIINFLLLSIIKVYQWVLSPLLGPHCRHIPSCSHYAAEAIQVHGPVRGLWLGLKRVVRCNPWGTSGYDPVPGVDGKIPDI